MIIKNTEEGYIKFVCNYEQENINIPQEVFELLNKWRNVLWKKGWIGTYPDGIGFGNISVRLASTNQFYITGSATGEFSALQPRHYSLVEDCNIEKNMIWCRGQTKASSESMSHYMIYRTLPEVNAVVHVHHLGLWEKYSGVLPTTANTIDYGTPEMAYEIERILKDNENNVVIMGGHREGIISYGDTLEKATEMMLKLDI